MEGASPKWSKATTKQGAGGDGAGDKQTGTPGNQQAAADRLNAEANNAADQKPPVATGGAVHSDSTQSQPGKETIAPTGKQSSLEVKPASPEAKAANSPLSGDKTVSSSSTRPPDMARSDVSGASKALPNVSLENTQPTQKKTYSETGSQLDSGKVQDTSASQMADRPGLKQSETKQNEPIGQSGRQNIEPHAPPAQAAKAQENTYQKDNTYQNQKITNYETKPEPKSASIPPPVIIPADIHQTQKNQNPASAAHQPETAPIKPLQDLAAKPPEQKFQTGETPGQHTNNGKAASDAAQGKNTDSPPKSPAAGELGANNSAGRDGKLVPEPHATTDANVRGGAGKEFDVAHENTTRDALSDTTKSQSQIGHTDQTAINTSRLDGIDAIIEKHKENPLENPIVPIGKRDGKEPIASQPEGTRDPKVDNQSGKDKNADIANKADTRLPGNEASSGSMGAGFDVRPGRVNDKAAAPEPVERIILRVENLAVNLADKGTVAKLLGVLEQIKTGKVTATDPESTVFAHAILSAKETNLGKIEAALKASDNALLNSILSDKLTPEQAEYQKLARWDLPKEKAKNEKLEAENQELKRDRNFLQGFISSVKGFFAEFVSGRKPLEPDASAAEIIDEITVEANNKNAVEQFMSRTQNQLAKYEAGEDAEPIDAEDAPAVASSPKPNQQKTTRDTHVVETLSNCEEIALLKLGNSALSELLAQINQIESTLIDDRPKRRDLLPGEVLYLPTKQEIQAVLDPPKPGATT